MRYFLPGLLAIAILLLGFTATSVEAQAQQVLPLGSAMPEADRTMPNASGNDTSLANARGSTGTVVIFWSNECPWVDRYEDRILSLQDQAAGEGIQFVFVNSNDASAFPQETLENSRSRAEQRGYDFPYLKDEGGTVARAFGASRTPHVYVFDADDSLVYVGAIDDSPGDPDSVQERYLYDAITALASDTPIETSQTRAFGCTIKL